MNRLVLAFALVISGFTVAAAAGGGAELRRALTGLKSTDAAVRDRAVRTIDRLNATRYAAQVAQALGDSNSLVRFDAVNALVHFRAKAYAPQIAALLSDHGSAYSFDPRDRKFIVTTVSAEARRVLDGWGIEPAASR
jgi:HEAT repeat protein